MCVKMNIMEIAQQNEIKDQAQGWTEAHKDVEGKNSTIYHPDLAVKGTQGSAQEGQAINPGLIVDVDAARDIANVMNEQSIPAGLAREKELQRQAETGLDPEQRRNSELMDGVKQNFPNAVREVIDGKGRRMLFLEPPKQGDAGCVFLEVMTLDGVYTINFMNIGFPDKADAVDWAKAADIMKATKIERYGIPNKIRIADVITDTGIIEVARGNSLDFYVRNLEDASEVQILKENLIDAEKRGKEKKDSDEKAKEVTSSGAILGKLLG